MSTNRPKRCIDLANNDLSCVHAYVRVCVWMFAFLCYVNLTLHTQFSFTFFFSLFFFEDETNMRIRNPKNRCVKVFVCCIHLPSSYWISITAIFSPTFTLSLSISLFLFISFCLSLWIFDWFNVITAFRHPNCCNLCTGLTQYYTKYTTKKKLKPQNLHEKKVKITTSIRF